MKYDDASWHYGGDFPPDSPEEFGAVHIALFLKWCFTKGWAGEFHLEEQPKDMQKVIDGTMSATKYFLKYCDEKLTDEDLNEQGNIVAGAYYGTDGLYLDDYALHFGDLMYVAPEDAHDFDEFASVLEARLRSGVLTKSQANAEKPWWKFW